MLQLLPNGAAQCHRSALPANALRDYPANSYRPAFDLTARPRVPARHHSPFPSVPLFGFLQGWTAVWIFLDDGADILVTMLMMREEKRNRDHSVRAVPDQGASSASSRAIGWRSLNLLGGVLCAATAAGRVRGVHGAAALLSRLYPEYADNRGSAFSLIPGRSGSN